MMWVEKVICPHCGRETNKAPFCKFCGRPLNLDEVEEVGESVEPQVSKSEESIERYPAQEMSEERKTVEQLANFYNWRHKLIELFLNGEASPEIFMDIYREYRARIQAINAKRLEMIKSLEQKMNELNTRLEQLKIRHEIGEISDRQYITDKLAIDRELSKIKPKLNMLHNVFDVRLADVPSYEEKLRRLRDEISSRGKSMGLSEDDVAMIVGDLEETLESLKDLVEMHKKLKRELDKLELRYRIGELTEEEYQAAKQKIERQMQLY